MQGYLLLIATVNGFTVDETGVEDADQSGDQGGTGGDAASLQEVANMARDYVAALPPEQFPNMVSLADEFRVRRP